MQGVEPFALGLFYIAFAFRNADKFFPRRAQVRAKLKLEKDGTGFGLLDRQSSQEILDHVSQ